MKIYFGHAREIDYEAIYRAVREDEFFDDAEVVFPHEREEAHKNNPREFYKTLDLFVAEVSKPATGLGIELGWAFDDGVRIVGFYKKGEQPSGSVYAVTSEILEYGTAEELVKLVKEKVK